MYSEVKFYSRLKSNILFAMARRKKALADDDPDGKGRPALVIWPVDGNEYDAKVVATKGDSVKFHYVGYNARHEEWLKKDDPRIDWLQNDEMISSPHQSEAIEDNNNIGSPTASRTSRDLSAERLIDTFYSSICPETAPTKRTRDESPNDASDKAPKRQLLNPEAINTRNTSPNHDSNKAPKRQLLNPEANNTRNISPNDAPNKAPNRPLLDAEADNTKSVRSQAAEPGTNGEGATGGAGRPVGAGAAQPALAGRPAVTGATSNLMSNNGAAVRPDNLCGMCRLPTSRDTVSCSG